MVCVEAHGLHKAYGATIALGLIDPNRAGKTTALNAILGLTPYQGELKVLGRNPWTERDQLMRDVSFIADVAVLPRWMRVSQALGYVAGMHPRFDRAMAPYTRDSVSVTEENFDRGTTRDPGQSPMTDACRRLVGPVHALLRPLLICLLAPAAVAAARTIRKRLGRSNAWTEESGFQD